MIDFQQLDAKALAKVIDFSILPKQTTEAEIREGCAVTRRYGFAAFYASSAYWAPVVREELAGMGDIEIGTIHDFVYMLQVYKPGDVVLCRYVRDGAEQEVRITLATREAE